jgi:hypothetical protein
MDDRLFSLLRIFTLKMQARKTAVQQYDQNKRWKEK